MIRFSSSDFEDAGVGAARVEPTRVRTRAKYVNGAIASSRTAKGVKGELDYRDVPRSGGEEKGREN